MNHEVTHLEHALSLTGKTIMDMVDGFFKLIPNILIGILIFYLFTRLALYVRKLVVSLCTHAHFDQTLSQALGSLSSVATDIFGILIAATIVIPSFKPAQLIAGLGITSVAVGFAFKDILQNFFAGLLLLWQKPFKIGDQIRTRDFEGTVEEIDIHSTKIITNNGQLVVLPNGDVFTNPIIINTAFERMRQHLSVSGLPNMSLDESRQMIAHAVIATEGVLKDPAPQVYLATADDSAPKFEVYFWSKPKEADVLATIDRVATSLRALTRNVLKDQETKAAESAQKEAKENPSLSTSAASSASAGTGSSAGTGLVEEADSSNSLPASNPNKTRELQQQAAAAVLTKSTEKVAGR
jgi:small conductance mechanosensitive channel